MECLNKGNSCPGKCMWVIRRGASHSSFPIKVTEYNSSLLSNIFPSPTLSPSHYFQKIQLLLVLNLTYSLNDFTFSCCTESLFITSQTLNGSVAGTGCILVLVSLRSLAWEKRRACLEMYFQYKVLPLAKNLPFPIMHSCCLSSIHATFWRDTHKNSLLSLDNFGNYFFNSTTVLGDNLIGSPLVWTPQSLTFRLYMLICMCQRYTYLYRYVCYLYRYYLYLWTA